MATLTARLNLLCPHCGGQIFEEGDDIVCLQCGFRHDTHFIEKGCKYCFGDVLRNYKHKPGLFKCCNCSRILTKREVRKTWWM